MLESFHVLCITYYIEDVLQLIQVLYYELGARARCRLTSRGGVQYCSLCAGHRWKREKGKNSQCYKLRLNNCINNEIVIK